ncbi:hypothetical protein MQE23_06985 [Streptomyces sp. HP-A2021]|uniref:hypothetical protein n=1 Tax=Streptomyces sp. HP-A2021 TaxID=2927875 RepID=UPI001FAF5047|nr:hypothetical protein [Streptomyces sp. HP-A2021]UOB08812.1 hypothetical protein MQE23_06985 [Streptomyces sp. HP-A2021]
MDLRNNETLFTLMENRFSWRVRCVERINYASTLWIERTRVLHANPLTDNCDPDIGNALDPATLPSRRRKGVWVRLPLAAFPKKPLLDLNIEVAGKTVYRIPRSISDRLSADYLLQRRIKDVVEKVKFNQCGDHETLERLIADRDIGDFLLAMCQFQTGKPAQVRDNWFPAYIRNSTVQMHWTRVLNSKLRVPTQFFDCTQENDAARNPLLALPWLDTMPASGKNTMPASEKKRSDTPRRIVDMENILNKLVSLISELQHFQSIPHHPEVNRAAQQAFSLYLFLGRFWIALVDCKINLNEPFLATITEMRTIDDIKMPDNSPEGLWKKITSTVLMKSEDLGPVVSFKDARSNEVSIRIADPNVEMQKKHEVFVEVVNDKGEDLSRHLEEIEQRELIFIYSASERRGRVAHIKFFLHPTASIRIINWVVLGIVLFTTFAIVVGWRFFVHQLTAAHVALLLTPSTFATSLLLVRDASALSRELTKRIRYLTAGLLSFLWVLTIIYYVLNQIHVPPVHAPADDATPNVVQTTQQP